MMSQKFKTQDCQWYEVKQSKYTCEDKTNSGTRFGPPFVLPQIFLISSVKPISSSISVNEKNLFRYIVIAQCIYKRKRGLLGKLTVDQFINSNRKIICRSMSKTAVTSDVKTLQCG